MQNFFNDKASLHVGLLASTGWIASTGSIFWVVFFFFIQH